MVLSEPQTEHLNHLLLWLVFNILISAGTLHRPFFALQDLCNLGFIYNDVFR